MVMTAAERVESKRAAGHRFYAKHRDMRNAQARARYAANPGKHAAYQDAWGKANPGKHAAYRQQYVKKARAEAIENYGGQCVRCGIDDHRVLCFDHVNDDGAQMRRDKVHPSRGVKLYAWLRRNNWPDFIQLLCWNCNHLKQLDRENSRD